MKQVSRIAIYRQRQNKSRTQIAERVIPCGHEAVETGGEYLLGQKNEQLAGNGEPLRGRRRSTDSLAHQRSFPRRRRSPNSRKCAGAVIARQPLARPDGRSLGAHYRLRSSSFFFLFPDEINYSYNE
jgi:hypothetical protein